MDKSGNDKAREDLGILRDILLAPVFEQSEQRDRKILAFIEQVSADLMARIGELRAQLDALTNEIRNHDAAVADVADGIATLGLQLRKVISKPDVEQAPQQPAERAEAKNG